MHAGISSLHRYFQDVSQTKAPVKNMHIFLYNGNTYFFNNANAFFLLTITYEKFPLRDSIPVQKNAKS